MNQTTTNTASIDLAQLDKLEELASQAETDITACASFTTTFDPAGVLQLIALARRSLTSSAPVEPLYEAALLAVERMRGCAATYIEDHAKDSYPGAIGLRPQDVASMWAQEIHGIDAKAYLDEAIVDLSAGAAAKTDHAEGDFDHISRLSQATNRPYAPIYQAWDAEAGKWKRTTRHDYEGLADNCRRIIHEPVASVTVQDERALYEAWELAEAERRKGEPLDADEVAYVLKRWPEQCDTYNICPHHWPAFQTGIRAALAQQGHAAGDAQGEKAAAVGAGGLPVAWRVATTAPEGRTPLVFLCNDEDDARLHHKHFVGSTLTPLYDRAAATQPKEPPHA